MQAGGSISRYFAEREIFPHNAYPLIVKRLATAVGGLIVGCQSHAQCCMALTGIEIEIT